MLEVLSVPDALTWLLGVMSAGLLGFLLLLVRGRAAMRVEGFA